MHSLFDYEDLHDSDMDKKTTRIISVIAATLLCGLPGLIGLCFGAIALLGGFMPGGAIPQEDIPLLIGSSIMILGLSLVFIVIPIGTAIWAWWSHKTEQASIEALILPEDDF